MMHMWKSSLQEAGCLIQNGFYVDHIYEWQLSDIASEILNRLHGHSYILFMFVEIQNTISGLLKCCENEWKIIRKKTIISKIEQ